jgi:hypothetical protein
MDKPTTLEECMIALTKILSIEEQAQLTKMTEDELGDTHHGLGQWLRNNWDLWKGGPLLEHMKSLGFIHPDDMSHSIIKEFWNRLNDRPSQIQEDIKYYAEYWGNKGGALRD